MIRRAYTTSFVEYVERIRGAALTVGRKLDSGIEVDRDPRTFDDIIELIESLRDKTYAKQAGLDNR